MKLSLRPSLRAENPQTAVFQSLCLTCYHVVLSYIYAADAAEGILLATEHYNDSLPVNIGAGMEITIADLVKKIAKYTGFSGEISWDSTKPDGQPRRCLDTTRALELFGFKATTGFDEGLKQTIDWYMKTEPKDQPCTNSAKCYY